MVGLNSNFLKFNRTQPNKGFSLTTLVGKIDKIPNSFKMVSIIDICVEIVVMFCISGKMVIAITKPKR